RRVTTPGNPERPAGAARPRARRHALAARRTHPLPHRNDVPPPAAAARAPDRPPEPGTHAVAPAFALGTRLRLAPRSQVGDLDRERSDSTALARSPRAQSANDGGGGGARR